MADFEAAHNQIAAENPFAATVIAERVWNAAQRLGQFPKMGRVGFDEATREWPVTRAPYLIVYRVSGGQVEILRVWHTSQDWRPLA